MSKSDANSAENKQEKEEEVSKQATFTRSWRVVKYTRNDDFEYDLNLISSAPQTSLHVQLNHLLALLTKQRATLNYLLAPRPLRGAIQLFRYSEFLFPKS